MVRLASHEVSFAYGDTTVLQQVSLRVQPGEVLALIGPNGAGKTTFLHILARLLKPRCGTVLLEQRHIWELSARQVAQQLALAPQAEGTVWPVTVEEAVSLGRAPHRGWLLPYTAHDREVLERIFRQTGLENLRQRLVTELSGGERRRVILARALVQEPQVLLLDEPTAHLDLRYQAEVLVLVQRLAKQHGLAVVVTLHDMNQAALCASRIALLAEGRLLVCGTPEEVLTPAHLSQAYGVTVVVARHPVYGTPMVAPLLTMEDVSSG